MELGTARSRPNHPLSARPSQHADALSRQPLSDIAVKDSPFGISQPSRKPRRFLTGQGWQLGGQTKSRSRVDRILQYLSDGVLPEDDKCAHELVFTKSQYSVVDRVLYHVEKDGTLRIIPLAASREKLFKDAHSGAYGAHLHEAKLYGQLSKHYWWPKMRSDVENWCRGCLTCATRQPGRAVKPVLAPIPVSGPFDRVGVDVIHFPKKSASGNSLRGGLRRLPHKVAGSVCYS